MSRGINNKKGIGIIAAILVMLFVSVMAAVVISLFGTNSYSALNYMHSQQAFFVAEAGQEYYLEQLQNQSSSWVSPPTKPVNMAFAGGTFTITTANAQSDTIDVTSTANLAAADGQTAARITTISASRLSGPGNVPEAFYYACYAEPHALFGQSTNSVINGNIRAEKKTQVQNGWTVNGTLSPDSPLDFPYVSFSNYRTWVQQNYGSGHVIDGALTLAAGQTYNGVYYVTGNVDIGNNVTLNGGIVSEGVINMRGATGATINANSGEPALVAKQTIDASNSKSVALTGNGLIYTEQGLNLDRASDCSFSGTFIVKQNMSVKNTDNITITFNPDIINNPPPFFNAGGIGGNWDEVY